MRELNLTEIENVSGGQLDHRDYDGDGRVSTREAAGLENFVPNRGEEAFFSGTGGLAGAALGGLAGYGACGAGATGAACMGAGSYAGSQVGEAAGLGLLGAMYDMANDLPVTMQDHPDYIDFQDQMNNGTWPMNNTL